MEIEVVRLTQQLLYDRALALIQRLRPSLSNPNQSDDWTELDFCLYVLNPKATEAQATKLEGDKSTLLESILESIPVLNNCESPMEVAGEGAALDGLVDKLTEVLGWRLRGR
jgi:hypothetical protein